MKLIVEQRFLGPRAFFTCVLGIFIVQIMALDMYAPALPSMQVAFGVSEQYLNTTVFSFLIASTITMVLAGPISDRFGRKPVMMAGCISFTAGSLVCAIAPDVLVLVVARALQAIGYGVSATLSAAFVKDAYEGDDLKLALTLLESLIILGPVAAPFLGSFVIGLIGWRGVFWALAAGGALTLVAAGLITETYDTAASKDKGLGASLATMLSNAGTLVRNRRFTAIALFVGVSGIPFFAFIAVSPYILLGDFQVSYLEYSLVYAGACLTNLLAPFVYMRLSKTWRTRNIFKLVIVLTAVSFLLLFLIGGKHPVALLVAFMPYALAEGIARPSGYLVMLDQPSEFVGTASAFGNFSYGVITALATIAAVAPWPSFTFGLVALTGFTAITAGALYKASR